MEDNVISHVPGEGESCFDWNRRKSGRPCNNTEQDCSSLFVEPLKWMTPGRLMLLPICVVQRKIHTNLALLHIWLVPTESIYALFFII